MKVICFSGTPGTGKTTLAKEFVKQRSGLYIDLTDEIKKNNLYVSYDDYDQTFDVDMNKFLTFIIDLIISKQNENLASPIYDYLILDGHLSHFIPKEYIDFVVVTIADISVLNSRLIGRGYPEHKVRDNVDSEIFETIITETKEMGHTFTVMDTTDSSVDYCISQLDALLNINL